MAVSIAHEIRMILKHNDTYDSPSLGHVSRHEESANEGCRDLSSRWKATCDRVMLRCGDS